MIVKQRDIELANCQLFEVFKDESKDIYPIFKDGVRYGFIKLTKSNRYRAKSRFNKSKIFDNHYDAVEFLSNYLKAN